MTMQLVSGRDQPEPRPEPRRNSCFSQAEKVEQLRVEATKRQIQAGAPHHSRAREKGGGTVVVKVSESFNSTQLSGAPCTYQENPNRGPGMN